MGGTLPTNTYYYITDHVGTVHAVTDGSGTVVESYRYSPFGRVLDIFDENGNTISKTKIGNRILFQGREYDWDTGFYYFRARYYDPDTCRWLSKDPIGINGGLNQYVFCGDNPVMLIDPLGLCEDYSSDSNNSSLRQRHWYDSVTTYAWITGRNIVNYVGAPYVNTYNAAGAYYDDPTLIGACELAQAYLPVVIGCALQAHFSSTAQSATGNLTDDLLSGASNPKILKGGKIQMTIKGNGDDIFNSISKGGKLTSSGTRKLPDGTIINKHISRTDGSFTIDINKPNDAIYKIRVIK